MHHKFGGRLLLDLTIQREADFDCPVVPGRPSAKYSRTPEALALEPWPALLLGKTLSGSVGRVDTDAHFRGFEIIPESGHHLDLVVDVLLGSQQGDDIGAVLVCLYHGGGGHQKETRVVGDVAVYLLGMADVIAEDGPPNAHGISNADLVISASATSFAHQVEDTPRWDRFDGREPVPRARSLQRRY